MWKYRDKLTKIVIETKKSKKEASGEQTVYGPFNEGVSGSEEAIQSYVVCETEDTNCIDLSSFDTSSVTNMHDMFSMSTKLAKIIYGFNFIHKTDADTSYMFGGEYVDDICPANRPDGSVHSSWEGISFN